MKETCAFFELVGACVHRDGDPRCTIVHWENLSSEIVFVHGYHQLTLKDNANNAFETYLKWFHRIFRHVGYL